MARSKAAGGRPRWTPTRSTTFLDGIAAGNGVDAAARAAGIDMAQVHHRLRGDDAFAIAWRGAIDAARLIVETRIVTEILHGEGGFDRDGAMRLTLTGRRKAPHDELPAVATREETDALILDRLAKVAARPRRDDPA